MPLRHLTGPRTTISAPVFPPGLLRRDRQDVRT
jgi:hypothetical protein